MGSQLSIAGTGVADLPSLLVDVPDFLFLKTLGGNKLLKSLLCEHEPAKVVVKVYQRKERDVDLRRYESRLEDILDRLRLHSHNQPSLLPLLKLETLSERAVFLCRQYFAYNLLDRLHSHPYPCTMEKLWFAYQLLRAIVQLHSAGLRHGDIKLENIVCTSWNWLFLTDIAFYKPTYLPADNPTDYTLFFESASPRRRCYIAPERFYNSHEKPLPSANNLQPYYPSTNLINTLPQTSTNTNSTQINSRNGAYSNNLNNDSGINNINSSSAPSSVGSPLTSTNSNSNGNMNSSSFPSPPPESNLSGLSLVNSPSSTSLPSTPLNPSLVNSLNSANSTSNNLNANPQNFINSNSSPNMNINNGIGGVDGLVTPAMDMFSVGCCIAEIFLEGEAIFDLPQLLSYREGLTNNSTSTGLANGLASNTGSSNNCYDPSMLIGKISHAGIRLLISSLIQRDPSKRMTAEMALSKFFPPYFNYLYNLFAKLLQPEFANPDMKIQHVKACEAEIFKVIVGVQVNVTPTGIGSVIMNASNTNNSSRTQTPITGPIGGQSAVNNNNSASIPTPPFAPGSGSGSGSGATGSGSSAPGLGSLMKPSPSPSPSKSLTHISRENESFGRSQNEMNYNDISNSVHAAEVFLSHVEENTKILATISLNENTLLNQNENENGAPMSFASSPYFPGSIKINQSATALPTSPSTNNLFELTINNNNINVEVGGMWLNNTNCYIGGPGAGLTMLVSLVCACVCNVRYPTNKLQALELMFDFGAYVDDDIRLGRLVPYTVTLCSDNTAMVRATAVKCLTELLSRVREFSQADARIFPEYIFPSLQRFSTDPDEIVRLAHAQCLAQLAETSRKFLDIADFMEAEQKRRDLNNSFDGSLAKSWDGANLNDSTYDSIGSSYDAQLCDLQETLLKITIELLQTQGPSGSRVKRSLLCDITRLCTFLARKRVNDHLLPHLITLLNDRDWQLRSSFFEHIVGVSVFVGRVAFQNYILPCIEQALFDVEEFVIQKAVHALTALIQLGLFDQRICIDIGRKAGPLLVHPSNWIRTEMLSFLVAMASTLGPAKTHCLLLPPLSPFLKYKPMYLTRDSLLHALKPPLTRSEFKAAVLPFRDLNGSFPTAAQILTPPLSVTTQTNLSAPISNDSLSSDNSLNPNSSNGSSSSYSPSGASLVSNWSADPDLAPVMREYLGKVAVALQVKAASYSTEESTLINQNNMNNASGVLVGNALNSNGQNVSGNLQSLSLNGNSLNVPSSLSASASMSSSLSLTPDALASLENNVDDPDSFANCEEHFQLYAIDIAKTVPDVIVYGTSVDKVQQDLYESLGVQTGAAAISGTQYYDNNKRTMNNGHSSLPYAFGVVQGTLGATGLPTQLSSYNNNIIYDNTGRPLNGPYSNNLNGRKSSAPPIIRQTVDKVPDYILEKLGVPPHPPDLGRLRPDTISLSPFYKNHHDLEASHIASNFQGAYVPPFSTSNNNSVFDPSNPNSHPNAASAAFHNSILAASPRSWRPRGVLVASISEHKGAVNKIAVSRDNLFMATGSDDGTVKLWDCQRLKVTSNVRSLVTYAGHSVGSLQSHVTSVCVCDSTHSVASASSLGAIHVFRVEYASSESNMGLEITNNGNSSLGGVGNPQGGSLNPLSLNYRFAGLTDVKKIESSDEGSIQVLDHFNSITESMLVYGTKRGKIHGWDLRSKKEPWVLNIEPNMGLLSALTVGPSPYCLVCGTSRGFIIVWDLRFQLPVQIWRHSSKSRILSLTTLDCASVLPRERHVLQHPTKGPLVFVSAEGSNQIAAFDLYIGEARMLLRVLGNGNDSSNANVHSQLFGNSNHSSERRTKTSTNVGASPLSLPSLRSYTRNENHPPTLDEHFARELQSYGTQCGQSSISMSSMLCCRESFIITAGTDQSIRLWDLHEPMESYRISSLQDIAPASLRYSARADNTTIVLEENEILSSEFADNPAHPTPDEKLALKIQLEKKNRGQVPAMTSHVSDILDLKAIEFPQKMLVTSSRDGTVKIWT